MYVFDCACGMCNDGIYLSTNTSLLYLSTNCLYFVLLRSIFFSDNFLLLLPTFKTKISYFVVNTFLKRASYFLRYIYIIFPVSLRKSYNQHLTYPPGCL